MTADNALPVQVQTDAGVPCAGCHPSLITLLLLLLLLLLYLACCQGAELGSMLLELPPLACRQHPVHPAPCTPLIVPHRAQLRMQTTFAERERKQGVQGVPPVSPEGPPSVREGIAAA